MMSVSLWKKDQVETGVSLVYLGDGVVLECGNEGKTEPHYFETQAEAQTFVIKQAYALLSLGYEVFT
jgi:hypothetical protein